MALIPKDSKDTEIKWPKPSPPGAGATIGERVEYSLAEGVRRFLEFFDEPLAEFLAWSIRVFVKVLEKSTASITSPLLDKIITSPTVSPEVKKFFGGLKVPTGEGAMGGLLGFASGLGMNAASGLLAPVMRILNYEMDRVMETARPDPGILYPMIWRGLDPKKEDNVIDELGWASEYKEAWKEVIRPRVSNPDLGAWYLRGKEERESFLKNELQKRGFDDDNIGIIIDLLEVIPSVPDLLRMAVREAFDPTIVKEYGLDQDTHKIPYEWLEKLGFSEKWANYFWYAHWELPSVMMGYEMLHRGIINEKELDTLMRSLDIMPNWIPKLMDISYSPYTRVDLRRMHKLGVIDETGLHRGHLDLGYNEEKASQLDKFVLGLNTEEDRDATKADIQTAYYEGVIPRDLARDLLYEIGYKEPFVEAYLLAQDYRIAKRDRTKEEESTKEEISKERELAKGDILSSYIDGILTKGEANDFLREIDYPQKVVDILLAKAEWEESQRALKEEIKTTKILYVNEEIDVSQVHERLGKYALPSTQVDELLLVWNVEKERRTERPSLGDLLTFYYELILDEPKLREQLSKRKFSGEYIEWYIAHTAFTIRDKELKEQERLQKEQQRIAESAFRTDRAVKLASLNVSIQEWKVFIADQKVAALYVIDPQEKKAIAEDIVKAQAEIAALELEKAKVPVVPLIPGGVV